jgi:hypothetical protein
LLNPPQATALAYNGPKAVAWNGEDFGLLGIDGSNVRFQRVYADGTTASSAVTVTSGARNWETTAFLWNGSGYAAVWVGPGAQVYFAKLSASGALVSGPTNVSNSPVWGTTPTLAWSGNGYLAVWTDGRNGATDIYGALLDTNGAVTVPAFAISSAPSDQQNPAAAWSLSGGNYVVVWGDYRTSSKYEIYSSTVTSTGSVGGNTLVVTPSASYMANEPRLRDSGGGIGMAWHDLRDGNREIYFTVLGAAGQKLASETRLTSSAAESRDAQVVWTGGEYEVFFRDARSGVYDIFVQRVSANGSAIGSNVQLTNFSSSAFVAAAWATKGNLLAYGGSETTSPTLVAPVGCSAPVVPGCPEALDAYNVSGTGATLGWLPASDDLTDIAYYQVFRDAALRGLTSRASYNDTGLSQGVTYQYNVRAVNAAQLTSRDCPSAQLFVRSSAALSLSVDKSGSDIGLTWTDEEGQSSYRVMRGTSPLVMTQIDSTNGTTSLDRGAAVGTVCFFYSIDEPPSASP